MNISIAVFITVFVMSLSGLILGGLVMFYARTLHMKKMARIQNATMVTAKAKLTLESHRFN